jgi:hypothetical protein
MRAWGKESQVGVYATRHLGPAGPPEFSVEEDFACLDGCDEDNRESLTNPMKGKVC